MIPRFGRVAPDETGLDEARCRARLTAARNGAEREDRISSARSARFQENSCDSEPHRGDQYRVGYHGVGTNEEIGQHPGLAAACGAIPLKGLTGEEQRRTRHRDVDKPGAKDHRIELFNSCIPDRQLGIYDVIDCELILSRRKIQLLLRPLGPQRVVGDEVQKNIRIDEDQPSSSPRVRAISWSVVMPALVLPRRRANLLSGARCRARKKTRPSAARSNSTDDPGLRPRWSRNRFGIVTWPLVVIFVMS